MIRPNGFSTHPTRFFARPRLGFFTPPRSPRRLVFPRRLLALGVGVLLAAAQVLTPMSAGLVNADGTDTVTGVGALPNPCSGCSDTADGYYALSANTTGNNDTAVGYWALVSNTVGFQNTAVGMDALNYNSIGNDNTAIGAAAMNYHTSGDENTAVGSGALAGRTVPDTGNGNTALGANA